MKREKISRALGKIDEKYIEKALDMEKNQAKPVKKFNFSAKRYTALAASFAFVLATALLINHLNLGKTVDIGGEGSTTTEILADETGSNEQKPISSTTVLGEITSSTVAMSSTMAMETVIVPTWENKSISEKYREFNFNGAQYSSTVNEISPADIGEYISDLELSGYDVYTEKTYTIEGKIYKINGISEKVAYAVEFEGYRGYYSYYNCWFTPATLAEMIDAYGLKEYLTFGSVWRDTPIVEYSGISAAVIWDMLLSEINAENVDDSLGYIRPVMSISVNVGILGFNNLSLGVSSDGYITTNIGGVRKTFYIGVDKTQAFVNYVIQNAESSALYVPDDGSTPDSSTLTSETGLQTNLPTSTSSPYTKATTEHPWGTEMTTPPALENKKP